MSKFYKPWNLTPWALGLDEVQNFNEERSFVARIARVEISYFLPEVNTTLLMCRRRENTFLSKETNLTICYTIFRDVWENPSPKPEGRK